jgi:molybdopterin-guanine dinucleotide biosynthesis protein A
MDVLERVVGVLLAGGRSSRMGGGDKSLRSLAGKPVLAHIVSRLRPQVSAMIINANGDPSRFAAFHLPVVADSIAGFAGPLAGVHAGLRWAEAHAPGVSHIVTLATDTPFFPQDLVQRLVAEARDDEGALLVAKSADGVHPVIGLWPVAIVRELEQSLMQGVRKVGAWTAEQGAREVMFPAVAIGGRVVDPFFNINRPQDLAEAEALLQEKAR